jgi:hypothetical protein
MIVRGDGTHEVGIPPLSQVPSEDVPLQDAGVVAVEVGRIGEHLGDDRPPGLGVTGQLDLDDRQAARGLDGDQVGVAVAEQDFPTEDDQPRGAGQGQDLRGLRWLSRANTGARSPANRPVHRASWVQSRPVGRATQPDLLS